MFYYNKMSDTEKLVSESVDEAPEEPVSESVDEAPEEPVVSESVDEAPEEPAEPEVPAEPSVTAPSTEEVVENVKEILNTEPVASSDTTELEERVKVLEERLEKLIKISSITNGYLKGI
jgi:hypothetical protein